MLNDENHDAHPPIGRTTSRDGVRDNSRDQRGKRVRKSAGKKVVRPGVQSTLEFRSRSGARKSAGRKPKGLRAGIAHRPRAAHAKRFPVQITTKLRAGLPSLRKLEECTALRAAFDRASRDARFRVVHHSIQSNHLHLIVEAQDRIALTEGVRALLIRVARALNRLWARAGSVFADRFHERELRSPSEVRRSLVYVLQNVLKHGAIEQGTDAYSSGPWFTGWRESARERGERESLRTRLERFFQPALRPAEAVTGLLRIGWSKLGAISRTERPVRT